MSMLVLPPLVVSLVNPDWIVCQILLIYMFLQMSLCYLFAGAIKMFGSEWRDGSCLQGIFGTEAYGHPFLREIFGNRIASITAAWALMLGELYLAAAPFLDRELFLIAIAGGVLLHLSIALSMGLNKFFCTWMAAYPLWVLGYDKWHAFVQLSVG